MFDVQFFFVIQLAEVSYEGSKFRRSRLNGTHLNLNHLYIDTEENRLIISLYNDVDTGWLRTMSSGAAITYEPP
ncbi:hypothetical protein D1AOALGA4SA_9343 [Olavius algarvensis Delta 1 endosymbiont]|nr:hypothetical protein D1AOALGA4SA_9343 [Olavius algarvensis Delta 1 endosymbiont]